jgi:hypothetical protein
MLHLNLWLAFSDLTIFSPFTKEYSENAMIAIKLINFSGSGNRSFIDKTQKMFVCDDGLLLFVCFVCCANVFMFCRLDLRVTCCIEKQRQVNVHEHLELNGESCGSCSLFFPFALVSKMLSALLLEIFLGFALAWGGGRRRDRGRNCDRDRCCCRFRRGLFRTLGGLVLQTLAKSLNKIIMEMSLQGQQKIRQGTEVCVCVCV